MWKEAEEAKRQEIAVPSSESEFAPSEAKIAALQDQKHEKAVSAMPAKEQSRVHVHLFQQERCLEDFASCTVGLLREGTVLETGPQMLILFLRLGL